MSAADRSQNGIYWQSRMGNNADGIGGNCHRYDIVTTDQQGAPSRGRLVVDYGIKIHNGGGAYDCSFPSPEALFAKRGQPDPAHAPDALLLTHSHEDHLGALKHAIDMGYRLPPLHCTPFTAEIVKKSLASAGIIEPERRPEIHVVQPNETIKVGGAEVTFVPVDHLPGASALVIRTKEAAVFHSGDYKFDKTMALGERADPEQLRRIGKQGIDMVVSDSTAAGEDRPKVSEREIGKHLQTIVAGQKGRAVVAGVLGTQLDRVVSLGRAAKASGRSLVVSGASLVQNIAAAERAGHSLVKAIGAPILLTKDARDLPADRALVVTTGAFAQPMAGLTRSAEQQPGALYIGRDTTVIIPQRAIPPVAEAHREMVNRLDATGARVITAERAEEMGYGAIHQSGHAIAADTRLLYTLLKPRQVVSPIHGAPGQIEANAEIARSVGIKPLVLRENGAVVRVTAQSVDIVGREALPRIGAQETGDLKKLPRAKPGEGRRPRPPAIYRYDQLDSTGEKVRSRNIDAYDGPARAPRPPRDLRAR
jgi:ribonuclease J